MTYRFRAHSMFDAELYRSKEEIDEWKKRDPISGLTKYLTAHQLIADSDVQDLEHEVAAEVEEAVAFAEAGHWEPIEELTRFVYSERVKV